MQAIHAPAIQLNGATAPAKRGKAKKILMIGNSFCYSFVTELYALAAEAGFDPEITNLYKAGCTVNEHWNWLNDPAEGADRYSYWITDRNGHRRIEEIKTIGEAIDYDRWDVITLQQHFGGKASASNEAALASCTPNAANLYAYLRGKYPEADYLWHQTWAYAVGHRYTPDEESQIRVHNAVRFTAGELCRENGVALIPVGQAWLNARCDSRVGDALVKDDRAHDSAENGGCYLNACVWFEVLFGKSCLGSRWRPDYALPENMIPALQDAAHAAVAAVYGENYTD